MIEAPSVAVSDGGRVTIVPQNGIAGIVVTGDEAQRETFLHSDNHIVFTFCVRLGVQVELYLTEGIGVVRPGDSTIELVQLDRVALPDAEPALQERFAEPMVSFRMDLADLAEVDYQAEHPRADVL